METWRLVVILLLCYRNSKLSYHSCNFISVAWMILVHRTQLLMISSTFGPHSMNLLDGIPFKIFKILFSILSRQKRVSKFYYRRRCWESQSFIPGANILEWTYILEWYLLEYKYKYKALKLTFLIKSSMWVKFSAKNPITVFNLYHLLVIFRWILYNLLRS